MAAITITKQPDYKVIKTRIEDGEGNPILDKYGHEQFTYDYSQFDAKKFKRKCPICGAEYEINVPELMANHHELSLLNVNGYCIGFTCQCGWQIPIAANSEMNFEDPLQDTTI